MAASEQSRLRLLRVSDEPLGPRAQPIAGGAARDAFDAQAHTGDVKRSWRVLMLVFNAVGKGTYWRALHLGHWLVRHGHQVTILAMAPRQRLRMAAHMDQGVRVVAAPDALWGSLRSGWDVWETLRRIHWLRGTTFDLVHAFEARPTVLLPALYLQICRKIPLVMDWCDWFGRGGSVEERPNPWVRTVLRPIETFFEERFRTRADGTTVICSTLHAKAVALGVPADTILPLRDGADVDGLRPLNRDDCRATLQLPADAQMIGYVGAVFPRDAWLMAKAFNSIQAALPSARLLLIGYVNVPVESMVHTPAHVIRTGTVDYSVLNRYLAACDICWLPLCDSGANRGRWPLKLNDYMAAGRATVATAVGDVTEVLRVYDVGVLAKPVPDDLAAAAIDLLDDPARSARLGEEARRVAETVFDWRLRAAELEAFYGRVLAVHANSHGGA
jgi:glycosyltransferase involved in cell wall biosynthesis